eukprot:jgi/Chlat1/6684/Chrsp49S09076
MDQRRAGVNLQSPMARQHISPEVPYAWPQVAEVLVDIQQATREVERHSIELMKQTVAINSKLDRVMQLLAAGLATNTYTTDTSLLQLPPIPLEPPNPQGRPTLDSQPMQHAVSGVVGGVHLSSALNSPTSMLKSRKAKPPSAPKPTSSGGRTPSALPMNTTVPQLDLQKSLRTVQEVWDEWTKGDPAHGVLSIEEREATWPGGGWRRRNLVKQAFHRRKIIVDAIKQRIHENGNDVQEAINYFEQLREQSKPSSVDALSKILRELRKQAEGGPRKRPKTTDDHVGDDGDGEGDPDDVMS